MFDLIEKIDSNGISKVTSINLADDKYSEAKLTPTNGVYEAKLFDSTYLLITSTLKIKVDKSYQIIGNYIVISNGKFLSLYSIKGYILLSYDKQITSMSYLEIEMSI